MLAVAQQARKRQQHYQLSAKILPDLYSPPSLLEHPVKPGITIEILLEKPIAAKPILSSQQENAIFFVETSVAIHSSRNGTFPQDFIALCRLIPDSFLAIARPFTGPFITMLH
jgi:hypothetical protein